MKKFIIEGTETSPEIIIDPENCLLEMIGSSRPENVWKFYEPVISHLKKCKESFSSDKSESESKNLTCNFKLTYFNSASAKFIYDIIAEIKYFQEEGVNIIVNWIYERGDDDMKEAGEDLSDMLDFKFNYIQE